MAAFALAWCLKYDKVSTAIVGASKVSQLEDSYTSVELQKKLTPEIEEKLNDIFMAPDPVMDCRTWTKTKPPR